MDDDRAGRALGRGALVLVGPAAVVEAAIALEQIRIPVRIVVQHDEHLAGEVRVAVIVPAVLRRLDAVADEHDLGILDRRLLRLDAAAGDELVPERELDAVAAA